MSAVVSEKTQAIDTASNEQSRMINNLPIADIVVPDNRARSVDVIWVSALARIIETQGLTNAITVREQDGKHMLVSGLHRLAAFKVLGRETIPARLSTASNEDEAKLEEVMENLGRNELNALDRCHHLYDLKTVYEKLHPEAKHGGDRKSEKIKVQNLHFDSEQPEIFGFAETIAEKIGLSRRSIFSAIAIWKGLSVASRRKLDGTWIAVHQGNLKLLSEQTPVTQEKVLDLMLGDEPRAASVADALIIIEDGRLPDGQEKRMRALSNTLVKLKDTELDIVLNAQAERVIAWAKRTGRI